MKRFAIVTVTKQGAMLGRRLMPLLNGQPGIKPVLFTAARFAQPGERKYGRGEFTTTLQEAFRHNDCLICIMAMGIVVRSITDVIVDKTVDPAVLVIDERGHHVVSLLSGHVGGANDWTRLVAKLLGADPVITTATDTEHVQALDVLAKRVHGWYPNFKQNTKQINGRLAQGEPVELWIDPAFQQLVGSTAGFTVLSTIVDHRTKIPLVVVSDHNDFPKNPEMVQVVPRLNVLGIGCRKNIPYQSVQEAFSAFCSDHHLLWQSFAKIASIDVKRYEGAIQYLAKTLGSTLEFYRADQLQTVSGHYPESAFVKKTVGVGNVACAAAEYASGQLALTSRYATHEVTLALGQMTKI